MQDMVLTVQLLRKGRDRFLITKPEERDFVKEVALLIDFVLNESQSFFGRMLGSARSVATQGADVIKGQCA